MGEALRFDNFSYRYHDTKSHALEAINITINEGEFVGIVGPNAAGKSTFCRATNGLVPHSFNGEMSGDVFVKGINTKDKKTALLAEQLGLVFADPEAQLSQMTVWEEIAFGPANLGVPKQDIFKRIDRVLSLMNIEKMRDRSPFTLSGGEQQRVAIASVLAMEPEILVLDEPTSNLDPQGTEEVFAAVHSLNKENKITVIMVEHEIELLAEYCSRIILINQGKVLLDGPPQEVLRQTETFRQIGMNVPQVTEIAEYLDKKFGVWKDKPYPLTIDDMHSLLVQNSRCG